MYRLVVLARVSNRLRAVPGDKYRKTAAGTKYTATTQSSRESCDTVKVVTPCPAWAQKPPKDLTSPDSSLPLVAEQLPASDASHIHLPASKAQQGVKSYLSAVSESGICLLLRSKHAYSTVQSRNNCHRLLPERPGRYQNEPKYLGRPGAEYKKKATNKNAPRARRMPRGN